MEGVVSSWIVEDGYARRLGTPRTRPVGRPPKVAVAHNLSDAKLEIAARIARRARR